MPQVTYLGPLLFVAALSGLPKVAKGELLTSYGDDTIVICADNGHFDAGLQVDLDTIYE